MLKDILIGAMNGLVISLILYGILYLLGTFDKRRKNGFRS